MATAVRLALTLPMFLFGAWQSGFVLSRVWLWYVVPYGAPVITWQAAGVASLVWSMMRIKAPTGELKDERDTETKAFAWCLALFFPWVVYAIAWWLK